REIWPVSPVRSTIDMHAIIRIIEVITAKRQLPSVSKTRPRAPTMSAMTTGGLFRGTTTRGNGSGRRVARVGSFFPSANSTTINTTKGTASLRPVFAQFGHQERVDSNANID